MFFVSRLGGFPLPDREIFGRSFNGSGIDGLLAFSGLVAFVCVAVVLSDGCPRSRRLFGSSDFPSCEFAIEEPDPIAVLEFAFSRFGLANRFGVAGSTTAISVAVLREVELDSIKISGIRFLELPAVTDLELVGLGVEPEDLFAALLADSE